MTKDARLRSISRQIDRIERHLVHLRRISYRYTWIRIAVFAGGLFASALALYSFGPWLMMGVLLASALAFGFSVYVHLQIEQSIDRHQIQLRYQLAQVARANLDWTNIPVAFHHRPRNDHPFEADLDIVGERSLLRLIDVAVSYEGSQRLRDWLSAPIPDPQQTLLRQRQVHELVPRSLFRGKLLLHSVMSAGARRTWRANQLMTWLEQHKPEPSLRRWLILLSALATVNAVLFLASWLGPIPALWQLGFALYVGLVLYKARSVDALATEASDLEAVLRQLRDVFRHLETFSYHKAPELESLCQPFLDPEHRPSRYLARLTRVVAAMGIRNNPMLRIALNAIFPWDLYFAYRQNQHKAAMAEWAPAWMDAWFELEALSSLANFAYLNPAYEFPEVRASSEPTMERSSTLPATAQDPTAPVLNAHAIGHPLIPDGDRVHNDFSLGELGLVAVVTGSNMAGKSVFLKTVALNLALAYAGGPVVAQALETIPFRLFTCMGISDSVTDGISYFYAEVKRLKALLDALDQEHAYPLFYCIDEIFRGTNNRERLLGSRAYVRALAGGLGVGLIATHDLELASLDDQVRQVQNYHFRDHICDDRMAFDYTLRPGPCPTTNALKIMQLEGLPAPIEADH